MLSFVDELTYVLVRKWTLTGNRIQDEVLFLFFKNRHKRDEISSCIVKRAILSCSPQRWESGEEFLMPSNEIANKILDIAAVIEDRWRKSLKTICRSHHVLESHIRRFISLVANVNLQLEDLELYWVFDWRQDSLLWFADRSRCL